jgi:hypothetical protein
MHSENLSNWVEGFGADLVLEFVEPQAAIVTAHPSAASAMNGSRVSAPSDLFNIALHASPPTVVGSIQRCTQPRITAA